MSGSAIYPCTHRPGGVDCGTRHGNCKRCGWNPSVEEERKLQARENLYHQMLEMIKMKWGLT